MVEIEVTNLVTKKIKEEDKKSDNYSLGFEHNSNNSNKSERKHISDVYFYLCLRLILTGKRKINILSVLLILNPIINHSIN
jgi:hypothetical protein